MISPSPTPPCSMTACVAQAYGKMLGGSFRRASPDQLDELRVRTLGGYLDEVRAIAKEHQPDLYARTFKFLLWGGFVSFMLGAEPVADFSLANRTLLFDIDREAWSQELLDITGLDRSKLPDVVPASDNSTKYDDEQRQLQRVGKGKKPNQFIGQQMQRHRRPIGQRYRNQHNGQ